MIKPLSHSLRFLLPLLIMAFSGLIAAYSYLTAEPRLIKTVEDQIIAETRPKLVQLQGILQILQRRRDIATLRNTIASFGSLPGHEITVLTDADGKVQASTRLEMNGQQWIDAGLAIDQETVASVVESGGTEVRLSNDREQVLGYASICVAGESLRPERCGFLYSVRNIALRKGNAIASLHRQAIGTGASIFGLALLLWLILYLTLTRRAGRLVDTIERFSSGDWAMRTRLKGRDELATIANAFDGLLDRVVEDQDALRLRDRAMAASGNGIIITDASQPENPIVYCNPAFTRITGYTQEDAIGRNPRFLKNDDWDQAALSEVSSAIKEQRRCQVVLRNYRKDGTLFWNELRIAPVLSDDGRLTHFVGIQNDFTKRKKFADALRESEAKIRAIVDTAADPIVTIEENGIIESFNPAAEKIFGYDANEAIGRNVSLLMPKPYHDEHDDYIERYLKTGEKRIIGIGREVTGRRKDGSTFPLDLTVSEFHDGQTRRFAGIMRDITVRKQTEQALQREHEFAERLIETAQVIILVLDSQGRIVRFNRYMEQLCGFSLDEVRGKNWFDTFLPECERQPTREVFHHAVAGKRTRGVINSIITKDKRERQIEWFDAPLTDAEGNLTGILATGQDITERQAKDEELRARAEKMVVLSELSQRVLGGIGSVALAYNIVDLVARTLTFDYVMLLDLDTESNEFRLQAGVGFKQRLFSPFVADGNTLAGHAFHSTKPVVVEDLLEDSRFSKSPISEKLQPISGIGVSIGSPKNPFGVLLAYMDTKRMFTEDDLNFLQSICNVMAVAIERKLAEVRSQRLQNDLMQASRISAMGELGTALAHELNQPLTAATNYVQACRRILQDGKKDVSDNVFAMMDKAVIEAERAASIIRHARQFFQTGELQHTQEDLNEAVCDAAALALTQAKEKDINVIYYLDSQLPPILMDKIQIQQVVFNLVRNAVEALEGVVRREIRVTTRSANEHSVEVLVEDTGPGVDPNTMNQLFKEHISTKKEGMGVGLSISQSIIDSHGGGLWISNTARGGATFHFSLPIRESGIE